ncbi:MAG: DUF4270 family protein [Bacteroidota bacterium]
MKNRYISLLCILLLGAGGWACQDEDAFWDLGTDFINGNARVILIDSLPLTASTVFLDSLNTSGTGQILVGSFTDDVLGTVSSQSYFQFKYELNLDSDLTYMIDSMVMILQYSGYYEGDTSLAQKFMVHRVLEDIEADKDDDFGLLYNVSSFEYDEVPLVEKFIRPFPTLDQEMRIPLPESLAEEWFQVLLNENDEIESLDDFLDVYKGFVLRTEGFPDGSLLGFSAQEAFNDPENPTNDASSSPLIRLYYREIGSTSEEKTYDFRLTNSTLQFNQIQVDRSKGFLPTRREQEDDISSLLTERQVFLQAGTALMPKIIIPNLESILEIGKGVVLNAEIVIEPVKGTYSNRDPLPSNLVLYRTNRNNEVGSLLTDNFSNASITSSLSADYLYQEESEYRFPVTDYITSILNTDEFQENQLLIGLSSLEFRSSVQSVILGGPNNKSHQMKLEIYYSVNDD